MLHDIFDHPDAVGAAVIAAKTAVIYLALIVGLRLLGRRELGQMSLYDFVMIAILATNTPLAGGLIAAAVLLVMNRAFNQLIRGSVRFERLLVGEPVLILHDGTVLTAAMRRQGITMDQLLEALREHGYERPEDVHLAVLEADGTISVVPAGASVHRTKRHFRQLRLP